MKHDYCVCTIYIYILTRELLRHDTDMWATRVALSGSAEKQGGSLPLTAAVPVACTSHLTRASLSFALVPFVYFLLSLIRYGTFVFIVSQASKAATRTKSRPLTAVQVERET